MFYVFNFWRILYMMKVYRENIYYFLGRIWFIVFGVGIGFGMGYSNVENDF